jgi:hypothetical protein
VRHPLCTHYVPRENHKPRDNHPANGLDRVQSHRSRPSARASPDTTVRRPGPALASTGDRALSHHGSGGSTPPHQPGSGARTPPHQSPRGRPCDRSGTPGPGGLTDWVTLTTSPACAGHPFSQELAALTMRRARRGRGHPKGDGGRPGGTGLRSRRSRKDFGLRQRARSARRRRAAARQRVPSQQASRADP